MQKTPRSLGLIGIGLVGSSLADILLRQHYPVYGYDIDSSKLTQFGQMGGIKCATPKEVAEHSDQILLSLMNSAIVEEVLFGPMGIIHSNHRPFVIIDTSTGDPDKSEKFARKLEAMQINFLESPISGSSIEIKERKAFYLIGGEKHIFEEAKDLMNLLTEKLYYIGKIGSASKAKLAINLIVGLNRAALAEGLVFAEKIGLNPELALDLFKKSAAYSHVMDIKGEKMLKEDFLNVQAKLSQHRKDVGLILDLAAKNRLHLPLSQKHYELLLHAVELGDGELDNSAIIKEIRRNIPKN